MTLTIDLDDRAWFDAIPVGGIGVHVVEGRKLWVQNRTIYDPPPLWAALSKQKCETCVDSALAGWIENPISDELPELLCPDCLGSGRPLVQVTVPCETQHTTHGCRAGCTNGRVSIGSVTVEAVVPIVHFIDWDTSCSAIVIDDMGNAIYFRVDGDMVDAGVRVNLGPNPKQYVGKFGVIVRRPT